MADPYRDPERPCPSCGKPLRAYHTRLVCDACNGIMVELDDLATAINDMTSLVPSFDWLDEKPGKRPCPQCRVMMTTCKLRVRLENSAEYPKPVLDHCATHGLWFDHDELAMVFEKVATKGFGGAIGRTQKTRDGAATDQGRWSAVFKDRSGGWGGW